MFQTTNQFNMFFLVGCVLSYRVRTYGIHGRYLEYHGTRISILLILDDVLSSILVTSCTIWPLRNTPAVCDQPTHPGNHGLRSDRRPPVLSWMVLLNHQDMSQVGIIISK